MAHALSGSQAALTERMGRGAIAGAVAGAVFAGLTMWFVASTDAPARLPLLVISTIVLGDDAIATGQAEELVGLIVHGCLSVFFGMAFGLLTPWLRTNGTLAAAGVLYGLLLYVINLRVLAPIWFPAFMDVNQPFEVLVHAIYGLIVGFGFFSSDVRRGEPILSIGRPR